MLATVHRAETSLVHKKGDTNGREVRISGAVVGVDGVTRGVHGGSIHSVDDRRETGRINLYAGNSTSGETTGTQLLNNSAVPLRQ